jgi:hypothetical protein
VLFVQHPFKNAPASALQIGSIVARAGSFVNCDVTRWYPEEIGGHPSDKWGGSVMGALQIKNIPWGPGDDFKIDASYAVGDSLSAVRYF